MQGLREAKVTDTLLGNFFVKLVDLGLQSDEIFLFTEVLDLIHNTSKDLIGAVEVPLAIAPSILV
jgi:hypothetical protein